MAIVMSRQGEQPYAAAAVSDRLEALVSGLRPEEVALGARLGLVVVPDLPKNALGKVVKEKLRAQA